jgi:5-methylcytosine-specific restriction endonuclease McrA
VSKGTGARGSTRAWRRARAAVIERQGKTCKDCRRHEADLKRVGLGLTVHHEDGDARNNALSNLVALCEDCHSWRHDGGGDGQVR